MGLTYDGLQAIRNIVEETINPFRGNIEALSNDIKGIYEMIAKLQKTVGGNGSFQASIPL